VVKKKDTVPIPRIDSTRLIDTTAKKPKPRRDSTRRDTTRADTTRRVHPPRIDSLKKADSSTRPITPHAIPETPPPAVEAEPETPNPQPDTLRSTPKELFSKPENLDLLPGYEPDTIPNCNRLALFKAVLRAHPYYNFFGQPIHLTVQEKKVNGREGIFYFLAALLIYFGFIRMFFGKYLNNVIDLFFRVTMRQQQIRDQLLQSPLPSMFLNLLYFITGGFFLSLVARYYDLAPVMNKWILFAWCAALLMVVYLGKFIVLKLTGWIFNISHATDTYIFIVYLVNKMIGIFLLPVLVVMAFAGPALFAVVMTLAFVVLVILFIYRFIISYKPIRNEIKLTRFHFFLYLCAFEIAPLLLIYKVLLIFVEKSY
jgi:hypothetical protein